MTRVALLGGSFNPPHLAHQMLALWTLTSGQADEVWLVPAYQHPFNKPLVPFVHRVAMCSLAIAPLCARQVSLCTVERELPAPSRTIHTVEALVARHPGCECRLVVGADILKEKDAWFRFDDLERLAPLIVAGRGGFDAPGEGVPILPEISSTQIRARLSSGQAVGSVLAASVLRYIKEHGLYGAVPSA